MLAASFFSRAVLLASVNANQPSPRLLSYSVRVVIIVLAVSMAFEELGVADKTILAAFSIMFGSLMLGLAIAFGLGGKDLARHFLERMFQSEHFAMIIGSSPGGSLYNKEPQCLWKRHLG